jgi:hypothetical protein
VGEQNKASVKVKVKVKERYGWLQGRDLRSGVKLIAVAV